MAKRLGHTITLDKKVYINKYASVGGKKETEGPLGNFLDLTSEDNKFGQQTWEKSESKMQELAIKALIKKSGYSPSDIDAVFGGDLLNQCIGSSYGVRNLNIPFVGFVSVPNTSCITWPYVYVFVPSVLNVASSLSIPVSIVYTSTLSNDFNVDFVSVITPVNPS